MRGANLVAHKISNSPQTPKCRGNCLPMASLGWGCSQGAALHENLGPTLRHVAASPMN